MPRLTALPPNYRPIPPLPSAVDIVARLNDEQFAVLTDEIYGPQAFGRSGQRVESLATALDIKRKSEAATLLLSIEFLYDRIHASVDSDDKIPTAVEEFLRSSGLWESLGDELDKASGRLATLVGKNYQYEREKKRDWLRTGLLDNATSFASFVELRPNFSNDRKEIDEIIPIVIFSIETENDSGGENRIAFQLSPNGLEQMRRALDDTSAKLDALKKDQTLSNILFTDEQDVE